MIYLIDNDIKYYSDETLHRSGWNYVITNLKQLITDDGIYLDPYIDRTFHWEYIPNKHKEIIPYNKKWIGFLHHTFDTTFNGYNCTKLFKINEFIESLKLCKCIIVLSNYLKVQVEEKIRELDMNIKVISLIHPTEIPENKFTLKKFIGNKNKKIIHLINIY